MKKKIKKSKKVKGLLCPHCGSTDGVTDFCPYDQDVNNTNKLCNCCENCRHECAMDI